MSGRAGTRALAALGVSAAGASSLGLLCCMPLGLGLAGIVSAGWAAQLVTLRPWLIGLALGATAASVVLARRRRRSECGPAGCPPARRPGLGDILPGILVLLLIGLPWLGGRLALWLSP